MFSFVFLAATYVPSTRKPCGLYPMTDWAKRYSLETEESARESSAARR